MKCRLEEDYEEGQVTMTWFFNCEKIEPSDRCLISFDGTYATLFIAACTMDDMGEFKVHFENKSGSDESTGKVTVKPVSYSIYHEHNLNSCQNSILSDEGKKNWLILCLNEFVFAQPIGNSKSILTMSPIHQMHFHWCEDNIF